MANKALFASLKDRWFPSSDTVNEASGRAYAFGPDAKLAQLAVTGTLSDVFYAKGETQLAEVLDAAESVSPEFVAKTAIYSRQSGAMKDMPALLTAWLTVADPDLSIPVFRQVIDNGRMLRNFVQIMRSGQVGRASLGSRPKRLIREWLENASMDRLMDAATGKNPSLADIVKMVHPKPATAERRAFYGWLLGRPYDVAALPKEIRAFENWKRDPTGPLPPVPFTWLTSFPLSGDQWAEATTRMGWQALRMNLNTLDRKGAFQHEGVAERVARRLQDEQALATVNPMPHQLMVALRQLNDTVPQAIWNALEDALNRSLANVPALAGRVIICPDVSGSMWSPITGTRIGAQSTVTCLDVAAMISAAVLRTNKNATVVPFSDRVHRTDMNRRNTISENVDRLLAIRGGGTDIAAPLRFINDKRWNADIVVLISDNQSWIDRRRYGATDTVKAWRTLKARNRGAKLICIDIQPYANTQAPDQGAGQGDILNVGGFTDAVFDVIADFTKETRPDWVDRIQEVTL